VDGVTAREGLPASDCDIDIARIDFKSARLPADAFSGQHVVPEPLKVSSTR
jgi:hypothetical protein